MNGSVGASGYKLNTINGGVSPDQVSRITGAVYATTLNVVGTGTVQLEGNSTVNVAYNADGTVKLLNGVNLNGTATTYADSKGTLTLSGASEVTGQVGANGVKLGTINAGQSGTSTFDSVVYANAMNVAGAGVINLGGNSTIGTTTFNGQGTVNVGDGTVLTSTVKTSVNGQGTLTVGNATVSGNVGESGKVFNTINGGANTKTSTFNGDLFATKLNVTGAGTVALNGNSTVDISYKNNGTVQVLGGKSINGKLTNDSGTNNYGNLTLLGSSIVSGAVGVSGANLGTINAGVNGSTSSFNDVIYANAMHVTGTGEVDLNGNSTISSLVFDANGKAVVAMNKTLTAAVSTSVWTDGGAGNGTLTLSGNSTLQGSAGSANYRLNTVQGGETPGQTAKINGNVFVATAVNITGNGTIALGSGYTIDGEVTTATDGVGNLTLLGASTVNGQVGGANKLNAVNAGFKHHFCKGVLA
ncbi:MAG: hypothetical protein HQL18_04030, partial [Candidatus Omnitrophica bacterium]|nr:hypothetical protein [Candidatus Omnitrophota bacterium]